MYGLKSTSGTETDMLFVKTEANTGPTRQFFCYIEVILSILLIVISKESTTQSDVPTVINTY